MQKRLFFGLEVHAPWPKELPEGRLIKTPHLTLAFLGNVEYEELKKALQTFPMPSFKVGFVGTFDQCLFFPKRDPRVVAWHVDLSDDEPLLLSYYETLIGWLREKGFSPDTRHPFTPHVTLARAPFNEKIWKQKFEPLPLMLKSIHLYESKGDLVYEPVWSYPLLAPFEEVSDTTYLIRGESEEQLDRHARLALTFRDPHLLPFVKSDTLETLAARADQEISIEKSENALHWEMILHFG